MQKKSVAIRRTPFVPGGDAKAIRGGARSFGDPREIARLSRVIEGRRPARRDFAARANRVQWFVPAAEDKLLRQAAHRETSFESWRRRAIRDQRSSKPRPPPRARLAWRARDTADA